MIVDRKKYRWYEMIVIFALFIGVCLVLLLGNFFISAVAVIAAPIIHYLFKRWTRAEDERVIMISGRATRRALQVFCTGVLIISLFFFYFKPNLLSTDLFEINTPSEDVVYFPAWILITSDDAVISLMDNNITITTTSIYGNVTESVENLTAGNVTKFSELHFYFSNPKPADMFGFALLISVIALWILYAVFFDYYSWKYGEYGEKHEK